MNNTTAIILVVAIGVGGFLAYKYVTRTSTNNPGGSNTGGGATGGGSNGSSAGSNWWDDFSNWGNTLYNNWGSGGDTSGGDTSGGG